jgi:hypothetical protein
LVFDARDAALEPLGEGPALLRLLLVWLLPLSAPVTTESVIQLKGVIAERDFYLLWRTVELIATRQSNTRSEP